jgi:hypothetical protein
LKVCFTITGTDYNRVACEDIAAKFVTWSDDPLVTLILTIKLFTLFWHLPCRRLYYRLYN